MREMIFKAEPKYGGLLVHIDDTDRHDYHTKNPGCTGEVVRCRDCKHSMDAGTICLGRAYRPYEPSEERVLVIYSKVVPDGFCAWGERRG